MPQDYNCPLGDSHCNALDKALQMAAQARQLAQDCVDCGLPMEDALNEIKAREELATKLKAKFFPQRV
jgi:hypothetical protein